MPQTLSQFTIRRADADYILRVESEDGSAVELNATYEQLDLIAEAIDEQLDADEEEALAVEGQD